MKIGHDILHSMNTSDIGFGQDGTRAKIGARVKTYMGWDAINIDCAMLNHTMY